MNDNRKLFYSQNVKKTLPDGCAVNTGDHPRWNQNYTHYGTDNFNLYIVPGGERYPPIGQDGLLGEDCSLWTSTEGLYDTVIRVIMRYDSDVMSISNVQKIAGFGFYVRAVKDYTGSAVDGTIVSNAYTDNNGSFYDGVVIGKQLWQRWNLRTTKYVDGTNIPEITTNLDFINDRNGAFCQYENNNAYGLTYGYMYNWYALDNVKLLVDGDGWRIPSYNDFMTLKTYIINNYNSITTTNYAMFLKSCRQVTHPLA